MNRQRGMTMVELLVSLAVVMVIIGAATTAYLKLLRTYRTQGRLAESYMANLTGLEMLRYDIEMAGFGLPAPPTAGLPPGVTYTEAAAQGANAPAPPYDPAALNDATSSVPSRLRPVGQRRVEQFRCACYKIDRSEPQPYEQEMVHDLPRRQRDSSVCQNVGGRGETRSSHGLYRRSPRDMFIILDNNYQLMADTSNNWCFPFAGAAGPPNRLLS